jgi:hypothetical protein
MLPDGTVLVTGGGTDRSSFNTGNAILLAEIWSPITVPGRWQHDAAVITRPQCCCRTRVLVAGGGSDTGVADQRTAEIFSPPYLFKGSRPTITSAPSSVQYGTSFTVATPDNATIASVALVAPASVTHAFNENQAFQTLPFETSPPGLKVFAPANANLAPPGSYMLFIVSSNGVPSVASFVRFSGIGSPSTIAVPNLVGMAQSAATAAITAAGLTVGAVTTAQSATVPADR